MQDFNFIILGGLGDLAVRKLYPALCSLFYQKTDYNYTIYVVSSQSDKPEQGKKKIHQYMKLSNQVDVANPFVKEFYQHLKFVKANITKPDVYQKLKQQLTTGINIFYLAIPPNLFVNVATQINRNGLLQNAARVVVEKPLGDSAKTFEVIFGELKSQIPEEQLYLIDHYLGKETVQNLLALRFANIFFEPIWNCHYIDNVQLTVAETVGVEDRWGFYDQCGALCDMVQNHMLQLLCLVAMEKPSRLDCEDLKQEKLKVLRSLKPITGSKVHSHTVRAQYAKGVINDKVVPAFTDEKGANPESQTETFVAIKTEINNSRWHGVPFYLRTGKRLNNKVAEIALQFKPIAHSIFPNVDLTSTALPPLKLVMQLQPEESIKLSILSKKPSLDRNVVLSKVNLNLDLYSDQDKAPSAYARLLHDVMKGDNTLFMHGEEIALAWKYIDGIIDGWRECNPPLDHYPSGSNGPESSTSLISRDNREWLWK